MNIYNVFNLKNDMDIYPLTGVASDPGTYYTDTVGLPSEQHDKPSSYYDQPWKYYSPRQINFYMRIDFR